MCENILKFIFAEKAKGRKMIALLLDPDKLKLTEIEKVADKINHHAIDFVFVGGSSVANLITDFFVIKLKKFCAKPVFLFPGDAQQITPAADAILFLSLLSGENPEYLIRQQLKAVPLLKKTRMEIIPTGYILIDGGVKTAVQRVSNTLPIPQTEISTIVDMAVAGMYMGKKLIYLEAGSGALVPVNSKIISSVRKEISIPLIVGGGIRSKSAITNAFANGADIVVIGTAFENDPSFFERLS